MVGFGGGGGALWILTCSRRDGWIRGTCELWTECAAHVKDINTSCVASEIAAGTGLSERCLIQIAAGHNPPPNPLQPPLEVQIEMCGGDTHHA